MKVANHPDNFDRLIPHGDELTNGMFEAHEPDRGLIEDNAGAVRRVGSGKITPLLYGHAERTDHIEIARNDLEFGAVVGVFTRPAHAISAAVVPCQAVADTGCAGDAGDSSCFGQEGVLLLHIGEPAFLVDADDMIPVIAEWLCLNIGDLAIDNPNGDDEDDRKRELKDNQTLPDEDFTSGCPQLAFQHLDGFETGEIKGGIATHK